MRADTRHYWVNQAPVQGRQDDRDIGKMANEPSIDREVDPQATGGLNRSWLILALLAVLLIGAIAVYWFGLRDVLTLEALVNARESLGQFTQANWWWLFLAAAFAYVLATLTMLPTVSWLSLTIAFMFGTAFGVTWGTVVAAFAIYLGVLGGLPILYFMVERSIGQILRERFAAQIDRVAKGVERDAFFYILASRLIPIVPYVVANTGPALVGVPLRTFMVASAVGLIPGIFVYAYLGASLTTAVNPEGISVSPAIIGAFAALGVLSLMPIVLKRLLPGTGAEEA